MIPLTHARRTLFWLLSLGIALVSWRFLVLGVHASMEFVEYHAIAHPLAFFAHVGLAPLALALMPFQFWKGLRSRRPALHRRIGRAYALAILLAGLGALSLAWHSKAGPVAASGFFLLGLLWLTSTAAGVWQARARRFAAHRRWMIRSAALTFAAVTLRLYLPLGQLLGFDFDRAYTVIAWACWVPNLLLAEWLLRRDKAPVPAALPA
ncbi:DUF2306 domain-containing protein [Frigidibacter sp. ROC022]|uniref:DUF2306 domain-containing protein n=1 Tax=Frigidibacter sp. ROC022 TaxID=2971796 RepID=UPI00215B41D1|nr:DUF2306 domain-containing protein [Frigidibacter sp. ROC022]MCR8725356.1 DUF2306 domain-containing protein [Frigidibacter sp. ROC022]